MALGAGESEDVVVIGAEGLIERGEALEGDAVNVAALEDGTGGIAVGVLTEEDLELGDGAEHGLVRVGGAALSAAAGGGKGEAEQSAARAAARRGREGIARKQVMREVFIAGPPTLSLRSRRGRQPDGGCGRSPTSESGTIAPHSKVGPRRLEWNPTKVLRGFGRQQG